VISPASLRDEIYDDVNGGTTCQRLRITLLTATIDELFGQHTQCKDCLDFLARAVWHAVTLFLDPDKKVDRDLQIFQIFEQRICILVSIHGGGHMVSC